MYPHPAQLKKLRNKTLMQRKNKRINLKNKTLHPYSEHAYRESK
jgi:hypothetical protein